MPVTTITYRYPSSRLAGDYLRASAGLLGTGGTVLLVPLSPVPFAVLGSLAVLFLGFGVHTARRHRTRIAVTATGIAALPGGSRLAWAELTDVQLSYYSTRRDGRDGWMQLTLKCGPRKLRVDSRLDGFEVVAQRAASAARENRLVPSPASLANFAALGLDLRGDASEGRCHG